MFVWQGQMVRVNWKWWKYRCVRISWNRLFWARHQVNHQNFDPSYCKYKCWMIFMGFFFKKIFKMADSQKLFFFSTFFLKISGISPWVNTINWWKGHQCGSIYMVPGCPPYVKKGLKMHCVCFQPFFLAYVRQPDNHIRWATLMPFASIYCTYPRTNPRKKLGIGREISFFSRPFFFWARRIFLLHPHGYQFSKDGSKFWWLSWFQA